VKTTMTIVALLLTGSLGGRGSAGVTTGEQIRWQLAGSGGGGRSVSASFILQQAVGQTASGTSVTTSFRLNAGYFQNFASRGCCGGLTGNVDCDQSDGTDISDLSALIDYLYISFTPLCCKEEANTDGSADGNIDISDLSALIDYLYISFTIPASCH
jgi:hypothetical protein